MKFKDPELVLLSAFRYALGRSTYIVSTIVDDVITNWNELDIYSQERIQKEIRESDYLGMDCDETEWQKILDLPLKE